MSVKVVMRWALAAAIVAVATPGLALAQDAAPMSPPAPPPGEIGFLAFGTAPGPGMEAGQTIAVLGFEGGVGGKTVTGEPFSATFSTQTTQTLADGNQIRRSTSGTFDRDSQGRTRRDLTLPAIGPWAISDKPTPHVVIINDAVAGKQYILQPEQKTARQVHVLRGRRMHGGDAGFGPGGPPPGEPGPRELEPDENERGKDVVTTSLGTQTINGVLAEGTRYTRTIPAGAIGNVNPIVITTERWYSPDLQVVVLSKRNDPRTGETITQLTNIQRAEPEESLFQVPSDYTMKQGVADIAIRTGRRLE